MDTHPQSDNANVLAVFAAICPDVPWPLPIKAMFLPQISDLLGQETLVLAIAPFGQCFRGFDLMSCFQARPSTVAEEDVEGILSPFTWTYEDTGKPGRINKFARSDKSLAGAFHLFLSVLGKVKLGGAGVVTSPRPFGLA